MINPALLRKSPGRYHLIILAKAGETMMNYSRGKAGKYQDIIWKNGPG